MKPIVKHIIGAALCLALAAASQMVLRRPQDRQPPVITMAQEEIVLSVQDDPALLLSGVTAMDDCDGNVTAGMLVESVGTLSPDFTANVTYAAFDSAGNVSKASRRVRYSDYTGMHFHLDGPLVFSSNNTHTMMNLITVEDSLDGDVTAGLKPSLVSGDESLKEPGHHDVLLRVTNSLGYTQKLTVPVEVYAPGTYNASVELSDYLVYIKQGELFRPEAYPRWLTVSTYEQYPLTGITTSDIRIQSNVNTAIPGTYSVTYYVEDGDYRGCANLVVIVEE